MLFHGEINGVEYFTSAETLDERGSFKKLFNSEWGHANEFSTAEVFVSKSSPGVIRGMHLQIGDSANQRLISVVSGQVFDVLIDLRKNSSTFLRVQYRCLDAEGEATVFVPSGVAHGFQSLSQTTMLYLSSSIYKPQDDQGVNVNSLGINWPLETQILSKRDKSLTSLNEWVNEALW